MFISQKNLQNENIALFLLLLFNTHWFRIAPSLENHERSQSSRETQKEYMLFQVWTNNNKLPESFAGFPMFRLIQVGKGDCQERDLGFYLMT